ncbi:MAG: hypothetical protein E7214_14485 [Clostridium sp.]|nr:hypothetical protein [Clostridium sp.]
MFELFNVPALDDAIKSGKEIRPEEYKYVVDMSDFRANIAIPIMVTGFGDIITWKKMKMYVSLK